MQEHFSQQLAHRHITVLMMPVEGLLWHQIFTFLSFLYSTNYLFYQPFSFCSKIILHFVITVVVTDKGYA